MYRTCMDMVFAYLKLHLYIHMHQCAICEFVTHFHNPSSLNITILHGEKALA